MKKLKRIFSLMIAVVMVLAMGMTVSAATITVNDQDGKLTGHVFNAYQIFTGTQSENKGALGNVQWGIGIDSEEFIDNLSDNATVGSDFNAYVAGLDLEEGVDPTAAQVSAFIAKYESSTPGANAIAKVAHNSKQGDGTQIYPDGDDNAKNLATGYYLIVDETTVGAGDSLNASLLQLTTDITITPKMDTPDIEKKVLEDSYTSDDSYGKGYNDVSDYDIGDYVTFHLIADIPNMTYYDTYVFNIHDTLSKGLTYDANNAQVKIYLSDDKKVDTDLDKTVNSGYDFSGPTNVDESESSTAYAGGHTISWSFSDLKTVVGNTENANYLIIEYKARLNEDAKIGLPGNPNKVYLEYSNNPNGEGTGKTKEDQVIVFTYELDVTKVNASDLEDTLSGAKFRLYSDEDCTVEIPLVATSIENVTYYVPTSGTGADIVSGEDGLFRIRGLDDGTYYLKEIEAPKGFNLRENPFEIVINANTANGQNWNEVPATALTGLSVSTDDVPGTADKATGVAEITVTNNKGATLPETGGMGTRIFYAVGAVLMIGAAVILITRKRSAK